MGAGLLANPAYARDVAQAVDSLGLDNVILAFLGPAVGGAEFDVIRSECPYELKQRGLLDKLAFEWHTGEGYQQVCIHRVVQTMETRDRREGESPSPQLQSRSTATVPSMLPKLERKASSNLHGRPEEADSDMSMNPIAVHVVDESLMEKGKCDDAEQIEVSTVGDDSYEEVIDETSIALSMGDTAFALK